MNPQPEISSQYAARELKNGQHVLALTGEWTVSNIADIHAALGSAAPAGDTALIDATGIKDMDTAGAWLIKRRFAEKKIANLSEHYRELIDFVSGGEQKKPQEKPPRPLFYFFASIGKSAFDARDFVYDIFSFTGAICIRIFENLASPSHFRFPSIVRHIHETGLRALPVICPLAFGISMVVAYQGAVQLQKFGADIYTIDLTVISLLREMAVLTTAILVAGRSGSAFAAEIGVMKMRGEIDALRTMGFNPIEMLVIPRLLALLLTLPLLSFIADVIGLAGGCFMAMEKLDITPAQYLARVQSVATPTMFFIGMIKAPIFALLITIVCTYQGMRATGSAENVGKLTTTAVVQSIFLVIMADALFSVLFSKVGI